MPNLVPDEGNLSARIVLIGEAPGANEDAAGRPFVGASGSFLQRLCWAPNGIQRSDLYLTNVVQRRPHGNKIETVPATELAYWVEELHKRLALLEDPWLLVPTGNTALKALVGKNGITKHRGSIYEYIDRRGRHIKCIPTIHPAATFREPGLTRRCVLDWQRISGDAQFRELRLPVREHYTRPDIDDLRVYTESVDGAAEVLAVDIETPSGQLTCIGFSYDPGFSITVPTTRAYWKDRYDEALSWIQHLLACRVEKAFQNGLFDCFYLSQLGYVVNNWQWDTLAMHHALYPNDSHDLAYMASVDTREPYWKEEAKDPEQMRKYTSNQQAFWVYNGKDVAVTRELQGVYYARLAGRGDTDNTDTDIWRVARAGAHGLLPYYYRHYRDMFQPLLGMSLGGIRFDQAAGHSEAERLALESAQVLARLAEIAGEPLHAKKGLSPTRLTKFMYQTLKLPKQYHIKDGERRVTTDESAIRKLMRSHQPQFGEPGQLVLDFRHKSKQAQYLTENIYDSDGRVRCEYRYTTDTGRLSSKKNPMGTGTNLQNVDRELLHLYLANEGQVLMGQDMSQIEDRWVKVIAYANRDQGTAEVIRQQTLVMNDRNLAKVDREHAAQIVSGIRDFDWDGLLWRARAMPWENDEHWRAAEAIYSLPREQMQKGVHRQLGKRGRHAKNYGMGPAKLVEICTNEGMTLFLDEAESILRKLELADPYILVYQADRRLRVTKERVLYNTWGRPYYFTYDRLDDEAFRRGYAAQPQAETADQTNQNGVIAGHRYLMMMQARSQLLAQKHDEVLFSVDKSEAWEIYSFIHGKLEEPRVYMGVELSVPADLFIGRHWGEKREFKRPPTRDELESAIEELL